jgi:hypothetical protein
MSNIIEYWNASENFQLFPVLLPVPDIFVYTQAWSLNAAAVLKKGSPFGYFLSNDQNKKGVGFILTIFKIQNSFLTVLSITLLSFS